MELSRILSAGLLAEAAVRALADTIDEDWHRYLTEANDIRDLDAARAAIAAAAAIAPYRAVLFGLVHAWEREQALDAPPPMVEVRS